MNLTKPAILVLLLSAALLLPACAKEKEKDIITNHDMLNNLQKEAYEAVSCRELDKLKDLLGKGIDINSKDEEGKTLLHHAVKIDKREFASLLIAQGAFVNAKDNEGNTPLHLSYGPTSIMGNASKTLLDSGADPKARNDNGETPLHLAVKHSSWPVSAKLDNLLEAGADINAKDASGLTPLDKAISSNNPEILAHLREKGAVSGKTATDIFEAVKLGNFEKVKEFIDGGGDVNEVDNPKKMTPLHYAAVCGYTDIANLLVGAGAKIDASSRHNGTPLHCALRAGHEETAVYLIDNGADVNKTFSSGNHDSKSCIHLAVEAGSRRLLLMMLDSGMDVDTRDHWLNTPLHYAANKGNKEIVELLVKKGADVNAVRATVHPETSFTPLDIASKDGNREIVDILQSHGAKLFKDFTEEERKEKLKIHENFKP